jgi:hypothetical protein
VSERRSDDATASPDLATPDPGDGVDELGGHPTTDALH